MLNWDAVEAIGESIGAAGVIVSLIYLATQIRHNSVHLSEYAKLTEISLIESNANSVIEVRKLLILNPDLLELYSHGCQSCL